MVQIGLLHLQPFMNSHFHFLIAVESADSNCDCDSHKSVPPFMLHSNPSFIYWDNWCNHYHRSTTIFELCTIICHTALIIKPSPYTSINRLWIKWGKHVWPVKLNHAVTFFLSFQCHSHCTITCPLDSIWLSCHLLHATCTTSAAPAWLTQELQNWTCLTRSTQPILLCCVNTSSVTFAGDLHSGVQERPVPGPVQLAQPHIQLLAHLGTSTGLHATDSAHHTCPIGLHCADLAILVQWASRHLRRKCWQFSSHYLLYSTLPSFLFLLHCFLIFFCCLPSS